MRDRLTHQETIATGISVKCTMHVIKHADSTCKCIQNSSAYRPTENPHPSTQQHTHAKLRRTI